MGLRVAQRNDMIENSRLTLDLPNRLESTILVIALRFVVFESSFPTLRTKY